MSDVTPVPNRGTILAYVTVAMVLPTVMAAVYFLGMAGSAEKNSRQQLAYVGSKIIQFAIPIVFVLLVARHWPSWKSAQTRDLVYGTLFGLLVTVTMVGLYHGYLRSSSYLGEAPARIRAKMEEFGVASPTAFLGLAVFLCAAHSFLEEYYWRWFVFGQLRTLMPLTPAIVLSSLGFMAHHVLIVYAYMPDRIVTGVIPASLAVAIGGAVWAWLYEQSGSLIAPWLSHALVDAGLFIVGWDMMRGG